jgi:hypothetical protein
VGGGPGVRKKLIELLDGVSRDAGEHVPEPCKRIDFQQLTGGDEAAQNSKGPATAVAAEKGPVAAANRKGEFIVHLIFKRLKTLIFDSWNSADTGDLFA